MKQYLDLMRHVKDNGVTKTDRTGTGTKSVFGYQMRFDLQNNFPLVTTKKINLKTIIHELIWFLAGDTNVKYLQDNGVKIWDEWAVKESDIYYTGPERLEMLLAKFENEPALHAALQFEAASDDTYMCKAADEEGIPHRKPCTQHLNVGDLGPVYGGQWRRWTDHKLVRVDDSETILKMEKEGYRYVDNVVDNGVRKSLYQKEYDQISDVVNTLKNNPDSRRIIVSAWNVGDISSMRLPPCHSLFQFYVEDLTMEERHAISEKNGDDKFGFKEACTEVGEEQGWHAHFDTVGVPRKKLSCQLYQRSLH